MQRIGRPATILTALATLLFSAAPADAQIRKQLESRFGGNAPAKTEPQRQAEPAPANPAANSAKPACPAIMQDLTAAKNWPEACGTGRPPNDLLPAGGFAGLWSIEAPGNGFFDEVFVSVSPGHCRVGYLSNRGKWCVAGMARSPGATYFGGFNPRIMAVDKGRLKLHLATGGFSGGSKFWVEVRPTGSPDILIGEWKYEDNKKPKDGTAVMRRRPAAKIDKVEIHHSRQDAGGTDRFVYGERAGRVERIHPVRCGNPPSRNKCQNVFVKIFGENLAGAHSVWIDPASHFQIYRTSWICRDGRIRDFGVDWVGCKGARDADDAVVGIAMRLILWNGATPGKRTLWVDGQPIPIELVLHGYPEKELPEIPEPLALRALGEDGNALDALDEATPFVLEAVYADDHPDHWVTVTMPGPRRVAVDAKLGADRPAPAHKEKAVGTREIVLRRSDDPKVFRSERLSIVPDTNGGDRQ